MHKTNIDIHIQTQTRETHEHRWNRCSPSKQFAKLVVVAVLLLLSLLLSFLLLLLSLIQPPATRRVNSYLQQFTLAALSALFQF